MLHYNPETTSRDEMGEVPGLTLDQRLDDIQRELRTQAKDLRDTGRNFSIFAVMALVISLGSMIAVAAKLDKKSSSPAVATKVVAPAKTAVAPAVLPSRASETLTEMKIAASASTVAAGKVTFNVKNTGSATHEFVVLNTPTAAANLKTDANGRADESTNIGETGDVKAGASKTLTLNLKPGHYALVCNLPGHYKAGMFADLTVK